MLIVIDVGLYKVGVLELVKVLLVVLGFCVVVFDEVVVDLLESVVLCCVVFVCSVEVDVVIGLGGGLLMDIVKLVVILIVL